MKITIEADSIAELGIIFQKLAPSFCGPHMIESESFDLSPVPLKTLVKETVKTVEKNFQTPRPEQKRGRGRPPAKKPATSAPIPEAKTDLPIAKPLPIPHQEVVGNATEGEEVLTSPSSPPPGPTNSPLAQPRDFSPIGQADVPPKDFTDVLGFSTVTTMSKDEVLVELKKVAAECGVDKAAELVTKVGAESMSKVDPARYPELLESCKKALSEKK